MIKLNRKNLCESCFSEITGAEEACPVCGFSAALHGNEPGVLPRGVKLHERYIIGSVIGKGGFGITYLAYDLKSDKVLSIKEYFPGSLAYRAAGSLEIAPSNEKNAAGYKKGADKFYDEAKMVSRFNGNPYIVNVYDFFRENGTVYLIMEFIKGITLESYVKKYGALTSEQTAFVFDKLSTALMNVHSNNFLHRDVAPDNIMICAEGGVKLIDFGAAREVAEDASPKLTAIVKQGYTPKEQYSKKGNQGAWSDIYAAGAVMYFALLGESPETPQDRIQGDCFDKKPKNADEELWKIIKKAAAIELEDRYEDVFSLKADMKKLKLKKEPALLPEDCKTINPVLPPVGSVPITSVTGSRSRTITTVVKKHKLPFIIGGAAVLCGILCAIIIPNAINANKSSEVSASSDVTQSSSTISEPAPSSDESSSSGNNIDRFKKITFDNSYVRDDCKDYDSPRISRVELASMESDVMLTLEIIAVNAPNPDDFYAIMPLTGNEKVVYNSTTDQIRGLDQHAWIMLQNRSVQKMDLFLSRDDIFNLDSGGIYFRTSGFIVNSVEIKALTEEEYKDQYFRSAIVPQEDVVYYLPKGQLTRGCDLEITVELSDPNGAALGVYDDKYYPLFKKSYSVDVGGYLPAAQNRKQQKFCLSEQFIKTMKSDVIMLISHQSTIKRISIREYEASFTEKNEFTAYQKGDVRYRIFGDLAFAGNPERFDPNDLPIGFFCSADMIKGGSGDAIVSVEYECSDEFPEHKISLVDGFWRDMTLDYSETEDGWNGDRSLVDLAPDSTQTTFIIPQSKIETIDTDSMAFICYGVRVKSILVSFGEAAAHEPPKTDSEPEPPPKPETVKYMLPTATLKNLSGNLKVTVEYQCDSRVSEHWITVTDQNGKNLLPVNRIEIESGSTKKSLTIPAELLAGITTDQVAFVGCGITIDSVSYEVV